MRVQRRVLRLGAIDLVLRLRDLFFALLELKLGLLQLRLQLRHFKNRQRLALMHDIANIHIDARHVTANLGVHIHYLVGLELTGQRQHMGNITSLRCGNLCGRNRFSSGFRLAVRLAAGNDAGRDRKRRSFWRESRMSACACLDCTS